MSQYNAKSSILFGKVQTVLGTPEVLADADAIAALNLDQNLDVTTEDYVYAGVLSRAKETDITDQVRTIDFEAFFPSAGGVAGTDNKLWDFFEACGAGHTIVALTSATSTNSVPSADVLTIEYYKPSTVGDFKKAVISDASGVVDFTMEIGKRAMFKSSFRGNYLESVQEAAGRVADFGTQKANIAARVIKDNLITVKLQVTGEAAVANFNICFGKLEIGNFFGFTLERYLLSCIEGHAVDPEAGDVKLTILEDDAGATYDPEEHWADHHSLIIEWGGAAGSIQEVSLTDIQLIDIQDTTLGPWRGQELSFNNIGHSSAVAK